MPFRPDNLLGNVLGVIADRDVTDADTGKTPTRDEIVERFAATYGDGDFDTAESRFWDEHGGPFCDNIMAALGYDW